MSKAMKWMVWQEILSCTKNIQEIIVFSIHIVRKQLLKFSEQRIVSFYRTGIVYVKFGWVDKISLFLSSN